MNQQTPGPPLLAEPEYCPTANPSPSDYARASLFGLLVALGGGVGWVLVVLATGRLWGILAVGIGLLCGLAVHHGASRLRSVWTGFLAAAFTALGLGLGFYLLLHPHMLAQFTAAKPHAGTFRWLDLLFGAAALFVAYRTAGPVRRDGPRL